MSEDNVLTIPREPAAADAPAQPASSVTDPRFADSSPVRRPPLSVTEDLSEYPLDWETTTVKLKEGRFKHKLRRPTAEEIFEREESLQSDIPIGKDGTFSMPDPTATEEADAAFYDKLIISTEGYTGDVPAVHKAKAIQGLYLREIYIDEAADPFAPEVAVIEEIGSGDEPDFTIVHIMRQPTEGELRRYRRRSSAGEVKPGKRGRQRFVSRSTLKNAVEHYELWCQRVEGVRFDEKNILPDALSFKAGVDPLIKRLVVQELVEAIVGGLLD